MIRALLHRFLVWFTGMPDSLETPQQPLPGRFNSNGGERVDTRRAAGE